jgi:hypothetical protein
MGLRDWKSLSMVYINEGSFIIIPKNALRTARKF